ncbi:MAG: hypothetical protein AMXMBFR23_22880 [Chloroflexota bacterium]
MSAPLIIAMGRVRLYWVRRRVRAPRPDLAGDTRSHPSRGRRATHAAERRRRLRKYEYEKAQAAQGRSGQGGGDEVSRNRHKKVSVRCPPCAVNLG